MPTHSVHSQSHSQSTHRTILGLREVTTIVLLLLMLADDIETNPGLNYKVPCLRCEKPVRRNQMGVQCDCCNR